MATVLERITSVVVDRLGVEEEKVVPEAHFTDDLNADSLDLVELIMAMEEEFSRKFLSLPTPKAIVEEYNKVFKK